MTTARTLAVERVGDEGHARRICCACGQVVAIEQANGDIEPVVIGAKWNRQGKLVVRCPGCDRWNTLPIRRAA